MLATQKRSPPWPVFCPQLQCVARQGRLDVRSNPTKRKSLPSVVCTSAVPMWIEPACLPPVREPLALANGIALEPLALGLVSLDTGRRKMP